MSHHPTINSTLVFISLKEKPKENANRPTNLIRKATIMKAGVKKAVGDRRHKSFNVLLENPWPSFTHNAKA